MIGDDIVRAYERVLSFLERTNFNEVFILKGYAGTGKTTLIKKVVDFLKAENRVFQLMAPTGRAAKILREKVNVDAQTIHRSIYSGKLESKEVEDNDISKKTFKFVFPLKRSVNNVEVIIVDESSMITDKNQDNEFFSFGSGHLLSDLLEYASVSGIKKVIFVGDVAQLPPVSDSYSIALDRNYFEEKGYKVESAELTEVFRQDGKSSVLNKAIEIRELLSKPLNSRSELFIGSDTDIEELASDELIAKYTSLYPSPTIGGGIIICYANALCYQINQCVRQYYFPNSGSIQSGDIVLVQNNNYKTFGYEIFNGDMAKVLSVGESEIHSNIPVTKLGKKCHVDLSFINVELLLSNDRRVKCKLFSNLLYSNNRDVLIEEQAALYIDFCMRHKGMKENSEDFKLALQSDPYFNVLKVKFGYAITCHKAQGGEWDNVFVDFSGRCGLNDPALRWCYTAITRSREKLYVTNSPHISAFSQINILPIVEISKSPANYYKPLPNLISPFHQNDINIGVKLKCLGILNQIQNTQYSLESISSYNYQERYIFVDNESQQRYQISAYYDANGLFKNIAINHSDCNQKEELSRIINESFYVPVLDYEPSSQLMKELYARISSACNDLNVKITNVVEELDKYYVIYYLKTTARFAFLQIYFSGNKITSVIPKSEQGNYDRVLKQLIHNTF